MRLTIVHPDSLSRNNRYAEQEPCWPQGKEDFIQGLFLLPNYRDEGITHGDETLHTHERDEENAAVHTGVDHEHHGFAACHSEDPGLCEGVDPQRECNEDHQICRREVQDENHCVWALLHMLQDGPDHKQVARSTNQEGQTQDHTRHHCSTIKFLKGHFLQRRPCMWDVHSAKVYVLTVVFGCKKTLKFSLPLYGRTAQEQSLLTWLFKTQNVTHTCHQNYGKR